LGPFSRNENVDIKISAHNAFLEWPSSYVNICQWIKCGLIKLVNWNTLLFPRNMHNIYTNFGYIKVFFKSLCKIVRCSVILLLPLFIITKFYYIKMRLVVSSMGASVVKWLLSLTSDRKSNTSYMVSCTSSVEISIHLPKYRGL
jgi:hypothetical protein